jgi:hypothetical protein
MGTNSLAMCHSRNSPPLCHMCPKEFLCTFEKYTYYHEILNLLHLISYEVPHCDFHHIDGDLLLVPWSFWIDLGGFIFMELMALDHLMDIFGLGDSHFSLVG